MMKIALLAGTQSGCGKTTIMLALLQYLKKQKHRITSFKAGPDFLDPFWHQLITERDSYNLDTQMIGLKQSKQLINKQCKTADLALIEGVMGLFDGRSGVGNRGSGADLAKGLSCPVILVVSAKGMSGSIVPLVSGFCDYAQRMGVKISGIIANHVGSQHHASLLKNLLDDFDMPPLLGWMQKDAPALAERHLGLAIPEQVEIVDFSPYFHIDYSALISALSDWVEVEDDIQGQQKLLANRIVAVAKDAACCFIYPANIDWLLQQGAQVKYFSVLKGDSIPQQADALWLPGGYPELNGQQLSVSTSWTSLNDFIQAGKPVLAECGGSMLLGQQLIDSNDQVWSMAGIFPYRSIMQKKLASLGYREDISGMKGHEFHYSIRECETELQPGFNCSRGDKGLRYKNLRLSYIHWYFPSAPEVMRQWISQI